MPELTNLSLFGVFFYAITAALCLAAARSVRVHSRLGSHFANWLVIALFFFVLMGLRGFMIEDWTEQTLRRALKTGQLYQERRELQAALAAGLATVSVLAAGFAGYRAIKRVEDRCDIMVLIANAASLAMLALVGLRLLSYHTIDALLYGMHLNWIIDIGATIAVALSALLYMKFSAVPKPATKRRRTSTDPIAKQVLAANRAKKTPDL